LYNQISTIAKTNILSDYDTEFSLTGGRGITTSATRNPQLRRPIGQGNVKVKGMGISFFCFMPLNKGLCRAVSKWCICDQSIKSIAKAYIHHFEPATRFEYERA